MWQTQKNELFQHHPAIPLNSQQKGKRISSAPALKNVFHLWVCSVTLSLVPSSLHYWSQWGVAGEHFSWWLKKKSSKHFTMFNFAKKGQMTVKTNFFVCVAWAQAADDSLGYSSVFQLAPSWSLQLTWNYSAIKGNSALQRVKLHLQPTAA